MRRALAQARVTVTEGNFQPIPIAIPNFVPADRATERVAGIAQVITNNLGAAACSRRSIRRLSSNASPISTCRRSLRTGARSTRRRWSRAAPRGRAMAASRRLFQTWDVPQAQQLTGQQYFTSPESWRRIAHIISIRSMSASPARKATSTARGVRR
jgi:TolB protein